VLLAYRFDGLHFKRLFSFLRDEILSDNGIASWVCPKAHQDDLSGTRIAKLNSFFPNRLA
jgi:hypothetical protein